MPVDQYLFLSLGEGYLKGKAFQLLLLLLLLLISLKGDANALMSAVVVVVVGGGGVVVMPAFYCIRLILCLLEDKRVAFLII